MGSCKGIYQSHKYTYTITQKASRGLLPEEVAEGRLPPWGRDRVLLSKSKSRSSQGSKKAWYYEGHGAYAKKVSRLMVPLGVLSCLVA